VAREGVVEGEGGTVIGLFSVRKAHRAARVREGGGG
jgi:hypothetical protein